MVKFFRINGHGHSCDRDRFAQGKKILRLARGNTRARREKTKDCREKNGIFLSYAYTQTIVRLYANDRVTIPDLKRIIEK